MGATEIRRAGMEELIADGKAGVTMEFTIRQQTNNQTADILP